MSKVVVVIRQGISEIIQNGAVEVEVIDLDSIRDGYDDSWDATKIAHFKNWAKGLPKEEIDDLSKAGINNERIGSIMTSFNEFPIIS